MRSLAIWSGRVVANAIAGGLAFSIIGALCGALTGFVLGFAWEGSSDSAFGVAYFGALVGAASGVVGLVIHLLAALPAPPGEFWKPFFDLTARVSWGQMWGTFLAITSFFAFELADSLVHNVSFAKTSQQDGIFIILFAPALMILGAVAGAIFKRD